MNNISSRQMTMICLDQLVSKDHSYRKILEILNFNKLIRPLKGIGRETGYIGYGIDRLFKAIFLQFLEDLSDRELEKFLQENNAAKLFCGFQIDEKTPHFSLFTKLRKRIGTKALSKIFAKVRESLKNKGLILENFTFVDSSHLISKNNVWEEKDKAISKKYKEFNNKVLKKVARDKDATIGCKGKSKYWYGYKKHLSVDMQSGLINKIKVTSANEQDGNHVKSICPSRGGVYGDKGYCTKKSIKSIKSKGCHPATIKKINMQGKNKDLDKWYSSIRFPYERVFSKMRRRVRYIGLAKNQFSEFLYALSFNVKCLLVLGSPPLKI